MIIQGITNKFNEYIDLHCKHVDKKEIDKWLKNYNRLLECFKNGTEHTLPENHKKEYFISFVWGVMATAVENNEGFVQGTFVFEDPDHRIVNFFNKIAYRRISSHFKGKRIPLPGRFSWIFSGYGIDADKFPACHKTALFAPISSIKEGQYTFLKIEEHPFYISKPIEFLQHSWRYIATRPRVWNIPFFRSTEETVYREEDTPHEYVATAKTLLKTLLDNLAIDSNYYKSALERIHHHGIAGIWYETQQILQKTQDNSNAACQNLLEKVKDFRNYLQENYTHVEVRKGKEVVVQVI